MNTKHSTCRTWTHNVLHIVAILITLVELEHFKLLAFVTRTFTKFWHCISWTQNTYFHQTASTQIVILNTNNIYYYTYYSQRHLFHLERKHLIKNTSNTCTPIYVSKLSNWSINNNRTRKHFDTKIHLHIGHKKSSKQKYTNAKRHIFM